MIEGKYKYVWGNTTSRRALRGRECVILVNERKGAYTHGKVVVQFDNGEEHTVSKAALRRIDDRNPID